MVATLAKRPTKWGQDLAFHETIWGDKVVAGGAAGCFSEGAIEPPRLDLMGTRLGLRMKQLIGDAEIKVVKDLKDTPLAGKPELRQDAAHSRTYSSFNSIAVDCEREQFYINAHALLRFDGRTGTLDPEWFPSSRGKDGRAGMDTAMEFAFGADNLVYIRTGAYGNYIMRFTRDGKKVPFEENEVAITEGHPPPRAPRHVPAAERKGLYNGVAGWCNVHQRGLSVAPDGRILSGDNEINPAWAVEHGLVRPRPDGKLPPKTGVGAHVTIFGPSGKVLAGSAVGETRNGHGYFMDRGGNLYATYGMTVSAENSPYYATGFFGLKGGQKVGNYGGCGVITKFLDRDGQFPMGGLTAGAAPDGRHNVKLGRQHQHWNSRQPHHMANAHWVYSGAAPAETGCSCAHMRWSMDLYPRLWIPAMHLHSIVVLDGNGNLIARVGRYGNMDDDSGSEPDRVHLIVPKCVGASDEAVYIADSSNYRLIRAKLVYQAEAEAAIK